MIWMTTSNRHVREINVALALQPMTMLWLLLPRATTQRMMSRLRAAITPTLHHATPSNLWRRPNADGKQATDPVTNGQTKCPMDIAEQRSKLQNLLDKFDTYTRTVDTMEDNIIARMEKLLGKGGKGDTKSSATATPPGRNRANWATNASNSAATNQDGPNGAPVGTAEKSGPARRSRLGLQRRLAHPYAPQDQEHDYWHDLRMLSGMELVCRQAEYILMVPSNGTPHTRIFGCVGGL